MGSRPLEHELSQFLDGRLPSGRRERLLERIDTDAGASAALDEATRAQELAQSLPAVAVGEDFADTLWQRIRSGEGTPDAVFGETLSAWAKVRYLTAGAAAAAAVLVVSTWFAGANDSAEPAPTPAPEVQVAIEPRGTGELLANAEPSQPVAAGSSRLRPRTVEPAPFDMSHFGFARIEPETVAQVGQRECIAAVATLQHRAPEFEKRIDRDEPTRIFIDLEPIVGRVRGATDLIRWMQDEEIVRLSREFDTALARTEDIVRRIGAARSSNDQAQLLYAVRDLRQLEVDRLRDEFYLRCCDKRDEFPSRLREQIVRNPDVRRTLHIVAISPGIRFDFHPSSIGRSLPPGEPQDDVFLLLRWR